MNRKEIKKRGKARFQANYWRTVLVTLIIAAISGTLTAGISFWANIGLNVGIIAGKDYYNYARDGADDSGTSEDYYVDDEEYESHKKSDDKSDGSESRSKGDESYDKSDDSESRSKGDESYDKSDDSESRSKRGESDDKDEFYDEEESSFYMHIGEDDEGINISAGDDGAEIYIGDGDRGIHVSAGDDGAEIHIGDGDEGIHISAGDEDVDFSINGDGSFDWDFLKVLPLLLIYCVIFGILSMIAVALEICIFNPLHVGGASFYIANLDERAGIPKLGSQFHKKVYGRTVGTMFLMGLFTGLWTLLFIVPGIIKSYEYRMIPYLLADNPEMGRKEAFAKSKEMMHGYKWKAFVLDLSFIGWGILSLLTCGVLGIFYVDPYFRQTGASFYDFLKHKDDSVVYENYVEVQ